MQEWSGQPLNAWHLLRPRTVTGQWIHQTTTTTTGLRPLYRSTCVSWHAQELEKSFTTLTELFTEFQKTIPLIWVICTRMSVKALWKSVYICTNYDPKTKAQFFWNTYLVAFRVLLNGDTEINDILSSESQLAKYYKPPWDGTFIYINLVITSCAAASSQSCTIAETWLPTS